MRLNEYKLKRATGNEKKSHQRRRIKYVTTTATAQTETETKRKKKPHALIQAISFPGIGLTHTMKTMHT